MLRLTVLHPQRSDLYTCRGPPYRLLSRFGMFRSLFTSYAGESSLAAVQSAYIVSIPVRNGATPCRRTQVMLQRKDLLAHLICPSRVFQELTVLILPGS